MAGVAYTRRVPRYDVPKAAPQPLNFVREFVNTIDLEHGVEWLSTLEELARWFEDRGLSPPAGGRRGLRRAHDLREALRALVIANRDDAQPPESALQIVNEVAVGLNATLTADGEISFLAAPRRVDGGLAQLVGIVFAAVADGSWRRLKACRNCRWAFFDYSRNRTAHWCSMSLCGNRQKTRQYRSKRARSV
jgi:predicted RNA-binding Zn ribbon-like protein